MWQLFDTQIIFCRREVYNVLPYRNKSFSSSFLEHLTSQRKNFIPRELSMEMVLQE